MIKAQNTFATNLFADRLFGIFYRFLWYRHDLVELVPADEITKSNVTGQLKTKALALVTIGAVQTWLASAPPAAPVE